MVYFLARCAAEPVKKSPVEKSYRYTGKACHQQNFSGFLLTGKKSGTYLVYRYPVRQESGLPVSGPVCKPLDCRIPVIRQNCIKLASSVTRLKISKFSQIFSKIPRIFQNFPQKTRISQQKTSFDHCDFFYRIPDSTVSRSVTGIRSGRNSGYRYPVRQHFGCPVATGLPVLPDVRQNNSTDNMPYLQ